MQNFIRESLPDAPLKILDLGSRVVAGQQKLGSYKQYITNKKWVYIGADTEAGENVDIVIDDYKFPFKEGEFDVVISGQTMEHIEFPWVWVKELVRVLKPGGICCIIAPAVIHEHKYPIDTFRYYPDGMKALAKWAGLEVVKTRRVVAGVRLEDTYLIARKKPLEILSTKSI